MPLKSRKQLGKLAILEKEGKVKKGTLKHWIAETPSVKKLPTRVKKKK